MLLVDIALATLATAGQVSAQGVSRLLDAAVRMLKRGFPCKKNPTTLIKVFYDTLWEALWEADMAYVVFVQMLLRHTDIQVTKEIEDKIRNSSNRDRQFVWFQYRNSSNSDHLVVWFRYLNEYLLEVRFWTALVSAKTRLGHASKLNMLPTDVFQRLRRFLWGVQSTSIELQSRIRSTSKASLYL